MMKPFVSLALVIATTTVAAAQPAPDQSLALSRQAAIDDTSSYVRGGALYGFDANYPTAALMLDAGHRLFAGERWSLWGHALVARGGQEAGESQLNQNYTQVRGGLEARTCTSSELACLVAGVDGGYRQLMTMGDYGQHDGAVVVPRAGVDVGTTHVRVVVTLDKIIDRTGGDGALASGGLALRW